MYGDLNNSYSVNCSADRMATTVCVYELSLSFVCN